MIRLSRLLACFQHSLSNSKSTAGLSPGRNYRPRLEQLEDRLVPATFNLVNGNVAGLIAAITTSNINNQPDTINLAPGGVYTLTLVNNNTFGNNGLPAILFDSIAANTLTINGNGATIQRSAAGATPNFRILRTSSGTVSLNNLTLKNGRLNDPSLAQGGAIYNSASLTLNNCTVSGNTTSGSSFASGGGIYNRNGATLNINNSTISGNSANGTGGAGTFGGGIDSRGTMTINNSTISGNSVNSTNGLYGGGGIGLSAGTTTINNSTITNNADNTGAGGGGIRVYPGGTTLNLRSTIVAGNTTTNAANGADLRGAVVTATSSRNLIGIGTATLTGISNGVNGNLIGTTTSPINPKLGPLANNGGPTLTHALAASSLARAKGQNFTPFANDQRGTGFSRSTNGVVDIGAVQYTPPKPVPKPVLKTFHRRFGR